LRNVRFSDLYLNSIEEKQIAEQKIQKAEFERQEAEISCSVTHGWPSLASLPVATTPQVAEGR
jgi:hypothetical protein